MTIRKAYQSETQYLLQLSGKVMEESSMGYANNDVQQAFSIFMPHIQNGAYYLLDEEKRKLKGWILLGTDWNLITGQVFGNLLHLYVLPKYRKKGVGKKLMLAAIKELQAMGIRTIQLNVFAGNPAKALYEQLGFKDVKTIMELNVQKKDYVDKLQWQSAMI